MSDVTQRPEVAPVRPGEELDWSSLEVYLRAHLPQMQGEFSVLQFPNGSANLTYLVRFGDDAVVVRRPPFGAIAAGAHDMRREHTVLSRLHAAYPRAPLGLHYCADESVIGAHFLVSEYRSGVVVWDRVPEQLDVGRGSRLVGSGSPWSTHSPTCTWSIPRPAGWATWAAPRATSQRQVGGWQRRWEAVALDGRGTLDRVGELLARHLPTSGPAALVHNDFKVDNCQFAAGDPDVVTSVFDWDMATLGDPLTDLGTLLNYWPDGTTPADGVPGRGARRAARPRRGRRSAMPRGPGQDLTRGDVAWYEAFGCWKTAVIMQQLYVRHLRGESADDRMTARGEQVGRIADRALALAETL